MANKDIKNLSDRPPEFVFQINDISEKIINILSDKVKFCLIDPYTCLRQLKQSVDEL